MPGYQVDGHDFFAVHEVAREVIDRARRGDGPSLVHVNLYRYYGHFEGDATTYRAPGESDGVRAERDCMDIFRRRVTEAALLENEQLDAIDREVGALIDESVVEAKSAPVPSAEQLLTDVYVSY